MNRFALALRLNYNLSNLIKLFVTWGVTPRASTNGSSDPVPHVPPPAGPQVPSSHVTTSSSTSAPAASAQPVVVPTTTPTSASAPVPTMALHTRL
jgi:hypothetical protein